VVGGSTIAGDAETHATLWQTQRCKEHHTVQFGQVRL